LSLFARLERVPSSRRGDAWKKDARRLSAMLGEEFENYWFCGGLDVLDRRLGDHQCAGYWGQDRPGRESPQAMVMAARERLLAAIAECARIH
jgi:hypothetical protein